MCFVGTFSTPLMTNDLKISFPSGVVDYIFLAKDELKKSSFEDLAASYDKQHIIIVTNDHIASLYEPLFKGYKMLVMPAHESSKDLHTIGTLSRQLLEMEAGRNTLLIGVGGGVVTDITGFLASVYMRGVAFGFVPTSLLGMVDAAVGGKNGVNLGLNKNLLGTVTQPKFILYDVGFLQTLPGVEWSNGFAEIIKCACIFDAGLFDELAAQHISYYKHDGDALKKLIEKSVGWKNKTVVADEKETGVRKLLNFGHTAAHAIENLYELPHGKAVAIGMVIACMVSERITGLGNASTERLKKLLQQYHLPVSLSINAPKAMEILRMDKKRKDELIDYIVLEKIGQGAIRSLPFNVIEKALAEYASNN